MRRRKSSTSLEWPNQGCGHRWTAAVATHLKAQWCAARLPSRDPLVEMRTATGEASQARRTQRMAHTPFRG